MTFNAGQDILLFEDAGLYPRGVELSLVTGMYQSASFHISSGSALSCFAMRSQTAPIFVPCRTEEVRHLTCVRRRTSSVFLTQIRINVNSSFRTESRCRPDMAWYDLLSGTECLSGFPAEMPDRLLHPFVYDCRYCKADLQSWADDPGFPL